MLSIGKENNHVVVHGMVVHYKLVHFNCSLHVLCLFCVLFFLFFCSSPPQSPSFLGHVVGYKLSRVALGTRMAQPAFLNRFSVNSLRSMPLFADLFASCFLELNDLYWVLRSTNLFFKVSRHFYDESEFIVASLSPLRGQSFIS